MAVRLTIDIEGEKQLRGVFKSLTDGLKDFRKPLKASTKLMKKAIDKNFPRKGAELGEPWQQRIIPKPWPILQKTGKMRRSFKDTVKTTEAKISNTTSYFKFHQSNKPRKTNLARRVMMKIDEQRGRAIIKIFDKHIQNSMKP